ncbi:MAG: HEAT repeat domain-containing protein [Candidatus Aminicenantes bacterium]|nr:HEAT repeat domain-containing protein [Candidatus Aminicenantes bacterium]
MSATKWHFGVFLTLLAVVFAIGLMFASIELPRLLDTVLGNVTPELEGDSHADETAIFRTELFLQHYHFRLVGYICFGLMIILIAAGFISGKSVFSAAGAVALFLPVFAQFAGVMFFLAGLGFLNLAWIPALDVSFDIGRLGDIVYLPYDALMSIFRSWGIDAHTPLVYGAIGIGLLLFILGTLAWFFARKQERSVADFWVYRFSRHPQYLGWILWSYGMLLALNRIRYPRRAWGIPASLPWLLSMMIIVGVALLEERKMKRFSGKLYEDYRERTSFLFPLPRFLRTAISAPVRLFVGKSVPERKGHIAVVLLLATAGFMAASHFYAPYRRYAGIDIPVGIMESDRARIEKLVEEMKRTEDWRRKNRIADALADIGDASIDPLIRLSDDPNPETRREAVRVLGLIGGSRAIGPLLGKLSDESPDVRFKAVEGLGRLRAKEAVAPLIALVEDRTKDLSRSAAVALGRIGSEDAVGVLLGFMDSPQWWDRSAAVDSLGEIGSEKALDRLMNTFTGEEVHVRRSIVVALLRIGSTAARGTLEAALNDEDKDVRLFASEALRRLRMKEASR